MINQKSCLKLYMDVEKVQRIIEIFTRNHADQNDFKYPELRPSIRWKIANAITKAYEEGKLNG